MTNDSKRQQLEGRWKQFKGHVQEIWGDLTGSELDRFKGKRDQLVGYIQQKTGEQREAIQRKIDRLAEKAKYSFRD